MNDGSVDALREHTSGLHRRVVERMPNSVKRRLAGPYNYVKTQQANRIFRKRDHSLSVTPSVDAPDHVVLVVVDALRADVLSERLSPYLWSRRQATLVTAAPWTFPAVSSLFTGAYPHEHGAIRSSDTHVKRSDSLILPPKLPSETTTLSDVFASAGYRTYGGFAFHMPFFALSGQFEAHNLYDDAPAEQLVADFEEWITSTGGRTFSYLHLGDLHEPVEPPASYCRRHSVDTSIPDLSRWAYETAVTETPEAERFRTHRRRLYEAAVEYVDDTLDALSSRLREEFGPNVAIVVTADHGEAFWEHTAFDEAHFADSRPAYCVDHGGTPYEPIARVPLAIDGFSLPEGRNHQLASLLDVPPTLTDLLGVPDVLGTTGRSLMNPPNDDRELLVESARYGHEKKAVYVGEYKGIFSNGDSEAVFFELPDERPVAPPAAVVKRMYRALPSWPNGDVTNEAVSGIAQSRLEDLGYI